MTGSTAAPASLYVGDVVHRRVRPVEHALRYRVFSVLADIDRLDDAVAGLRLASRNRFNLVSLYDRDHGDGGCDLRGYLDGLAAGAELPEPIATYRMLAYPRILGFVFNPLTVYYGYDDAGTIRLMIYEVRNTFGQMMTYVIPARPVGGVIAQSADKAFYVSPFNDVSGSYRFRITPPDESLTVGIVLSDDDGPMLNAHFHGHRRPLTDGALLRALAGTGWMTLKVVAGIHFEAARLLLKGMKLRPRPDAPSRDVRFTKPKAP